MALKIFTTEDGSHSLYSETYGQSYHSRFGAVTESRHVFLQGCALPERAKRRENVRVLEIGFGTGLNFWLTAQLFYQTDAALEYWAVDKQWPPAALLERLNHHNLYACTEVRQRFLEWRNRCVKPQTQAYNFTFDSIHLLLFWREALEIKWPRDWFDAVFLDAFSPDVNPELWTVSHLKTLYTALKSGGILATYSARRTVREALQQAGFRIEKHPGPKGKREIIRAYKDLNK